MHEVSFKDQMIQNAEVAINAKRRRKQELLDEVADLERDEQEARAVLQLLRTGKASGTYKTISKQEFEEAVRVAGADGAVFTPGDLAGLLGIATNTAAGRLYKSSVRDGSVEQVQKGGPGVSAQYKLVSP